MIITIKATSEELKDDKPYYIEWEAVGTDGKEIKVKLYPSIKIGETWLHFEDRWDEFKGAQDKSYDIERASIKQEGNRVWKPVIKATEVKDVFLLKAKAEFDKAETNERQKSICASYAMEIEVALIGQGKDLSATRVCALTTMFYRLVTTSELDMEEINEYKKDIPKATSKVRQETPEWTVKDYVEALRNQDYKIWWKDWATQNKVENKPTLKETLEAMNIEQLYELKGRLK